MLNENREKILSLYKENALLHERASRYISAAGSLLSDNYRIALDATDVPKAVKFAARFAKKEFKPQNHTGTESRRFLSGFTPSGHIFFKSTVHMLANRIFVIDDTYGASSRVIMSVLRATALENGYDIITCCCPVNPDEKIEHIIIPSLSLAFCTGNQYLTFDNVERCYHSRRFTDLQKLRRKKQRLSFNRKAVRELLQSTVDILTEAKAVHDNLEKHYINAMDFEKVEKITIKTVSEFLAMIK